MLGTGLTIPSKKTATIYIKDYSKLQRGKERKKIKLKPYRYSLITISIFRKSSNYKT